MPSTDKDRYKFISLSFCLMSTDKLVDLTVPLILKGNFSESRKVIFFFLKKEKNVFGGYILITIANIAEKANLKLRPLFYSD